MTPDISTDRVDNVLERIFPDGDHPEAANSRHICPNQTLKRAARDLLATSHPDLSQVDCAVSEGELQLRGAVPSYYTKQLAQSIIMKRYGRSLKVDNGLVVDKVD